MLVEWAVEEVSHVFVGYIHIIRIITSKGAFSILQLLGECCRLRGRIDITRANQKPLLHIARTNHLAVFDIANKLYTLDAILEYKQFVLGITTKKLYTLDAILEYSLF